MLANYHTHTKRCNHAQGEDREYVENAIEAGIDILGFSDHIPWLFETDYRSGTRMKASLTEDYISCMEKLKKEYEKDIKIYIGFEAEYVSGIMDKQYEFIDQYPYDYMILGEHFTTSEEKGAPYTGFETTKEEDLVLYVDTCIEGMETGRYRYLAHPDLLNYVGSKEIYYREYKRLCEYLKSKDSPVEINRLGLFEGRHYPNDDFFEIAREVGNSCIIGFDAHTPDVLSDLKTYEECVKYAESFNLPIVETLPGLD
ncbi:MAG: histidinol-phosphatase [Lachnospiraceae bacterium]|nr:histidinol-phosphatase [Lachnospiraceae bacterium]